MPKIHELHMILPDREIILKRMGSITGVGPSIPSKLLFLASWIYDLTEGRVLKNKTGKSCCPVTDAVEVDSEWLMSGRYIPRTKKVQ